MQKQEGYIAQLEKETQFCREQLSIVLKNVKDVLNEKEAEKRSEEVNKAVSGVFATIQGWQNNIPPNNKVRFSNMIFKNRVVIALFSFRNWSFSSLKTSN